MSEMSIQKDFLVLKPTSMT